MQSLLAIADPKTHAVVGGVGPFSNSVRPFTINAAETLCFVNINELLGFEVGDLKTGKMLHRVEVAGFEKGPVKRHGCPSHGIGLTPDEKELGVALVDIGGGTADLAIFERGSLWHTAVIAVGGDHFTNDIAVGLRTPIPDAEKLKRRSGCALTSLVPEDETMEGIIDLYRRVIAHGDEPLARQLFPEDE